MERPVISVIMANYNGAKYLSAALKSVLSQSLSKIEILLADDASTDGSVALARQFANTEPRLHIDTSSKNAGPAAARNRALDAAKGDWIAVVDSDDLIHPQRFELMLAAADKLHTDAVCDDLTYFLDGAVRPGKTLLGAACPDAPQPLAAVDFVSVAPRAPQLGYLKPIIRRAALNGLRYREDIRIGEDHDFYMRFLLNGGKMHLLPESYYLYRRHQASLSHRLHPDDVRAMIAVQDDLQADYPDLPDILRRAFATRRAALHKPLAFETLVQHIKSRQFFCALRDCAYRPALLGQLATVCYAQLSRRWIAQDPQIETTDPSQWTEQDWAANLAPERY